ncbi:MAG: two-component system response regulator [Thermomicrobiales bacterium]
MDTATRRPHILVCDDDHAMRGIFNEVFTDEGYLVTVQPTICESTEHVTDLAPDLIVLDLMFDGMPRGFHFLQCLKTTPATQAIPVLVCTAAAVLDNDTRGHLRRWECASVTKPFDLDDLIAAVHECLGQKEAVA